MRRALTFLAVTGWLGVHAFLWTLLPPVPRWTVPGFVPDSFAFTPDGRSLVTADPAEVIVWDRATGLRERTIPRPGRRPTDSDRQAVLMMSPTDRRAIVYGAGGSLSQRPYLIDLNTGKADALSTFADMVPGDDPVIGFLPDGRAGFQLAVSLTDGGDVVMRLWDLPDGPRRTFPIESRLYHELSFSADGRRAVAVLHKLHPAPGTIQILDVVGARITHTLRFDRKVVRAALSADGRTVAVSTCPIYEGGAQGVPEVELWDAESGRRICSIGTGLGRGWNAAGQLVVLDGQTVRLLRAPDGSEVARWSAPESNGVYSGELTADGRLLLIVNTHYLPNAVRWWYERLPGQPFDPNRSTDYYAIFDTQTGRELANLDTGKPKQVTLAADGNAFAIADVNGLWFYDIPPRTPGGIVLGLMIVEVGLLTACTAWRRWRARGTHEVGRRKPGASGI
jgi:WD40 repeat protein